MNKNFTENKLLRPMVWQSETTQCDVITHRTPNGRTFIQSFNYHNYEVFRTAFRLMQK